MTCVDLPLEQSSSAAKNAKSNMLVNVFIVSILIWVSPVLFNKYTLISKSYTKVLHLFKKSKSFCIFFSFLLHL
jgi:hypothetical protein